MKRYRQPTVFMSGDHFGMWVWFLGMLRDTGRITPELFRKKCRRANRSFREQVRDVGGTPEQLSGSPLSREEVKQLARELWAKL